MKQKILQKIANRLTQLSVKQEPEEAYNELLTCSIKCFNDLCAIYRFTEEEETYLWNQSIL
ncbi:MAG: hypothetical protein ACI4OP_04960 [Candidatus Coprovivens sp.]